MSFSDLRSNYLGLSLRSPVIVGPCPMSLIPEHVRQMTIAGAGAIVLPCQLDEIASGKRTDGEAPRRRQPARGASGFEASLGAIRRLKEVTGIPVIANLHGALDTSWLDAAAALEEAGASALEVNFDCQIARPEEMADLLEERLVSRVAEVCKELVIPVAACLLPYHTNPSNLAWSLLEAGARGIVCFGREPTWEIRLDSIEASQTWSASNIGATHRTLSGIVRMASGNAPLSIAGFGGISSTEDVIRALLAGADVVVMVSELYRSGPDAITHVLEGLSVYLERHNFRSLEELLASRPTPQLCVRDQDSLGKAFP